MYKYKLNLNYINTYYKSITNNFKEDGYYCVTICAETKGVLYEFAKSICGYSNELTIPISYSDINIIDIII